MKQKTLIGVSLLILAFFGVLFSCSDYTSEIDALGPHKRLLSRSEIVRAFEADYAAVQRTRTDNQLDESVILDPIQILPQWDSMMIYECESYAQAATPFGATYGYRLARISEEGDTLLSPLPARVMVHKYADAEQAVSWLLFSIRDENSNAESGFYGLVVHATLAGEPFAVSRYDNDNLSYALRIGGNSVHRTAVSAAINNVLSNTYVARVDVVATTRGVNDNNIIEDVVIVGYRPIKSTPTIEYESPLEDLADVNWTGDDAGGGGDLEMDNGSGDLYGQYPNQSDSLQLKEYRNNPKIKADEYFAKMLDSLFQDCMGQMLINGIDVSIEILNKPDENSKAGPCRNKETGEIVGYTIVMGNKRNQLILMEELMHVYQGVGSEDFYNTKLNQEIEAKLMWHLYAMRTDSPINTYRMLAGYEGYHHFEMMKVLAYEGKWHTEDFYNEYEAAAKSLRTITGYSDEREYTYDSTRKEIPNLLDIMEDCLMFNEK